MVVVIIFSAYISSDITVNGTVFKSDRNNPTNKPQRELGGSRSVHVLEKSNR